ncbi:MAG: DUF1800 domain-containing protein [Methylophilus sp.]|nr:DUF1800 domain-containing protein [Methylophilus sp.]
MLINMSAQAIAINRFGLGARLDETPPSDPKQWLLAQLTQYQAQPSAWNNQRKSADILADMAQDLMQMRQADERKKTAAKRLFKIEVRDDYIAACNVRTLSALTSSTPFVERLVHFWANHFAISAQKPAVTEMAGAFELEAIRPHVLGNFKDMLIAVEQHPAMLIYLDQAKSMGPNSRAVEKLAARAPEKKRGLNENLAREILELHTLGVRSGYSQADVTEFAKALTGWSVVDGHKRDKEAQNGNNGFVYRPFIHEPGSRNILGKSYAQNHMAQAEAVLNDLAIAPATATHIATKLARHFVSDQPPASLIDKLAQSFLKSGGNLNQVYRALIESPEAWQAAPAKFKTPWEWFVSSARALGKNKLEGLNVAQILNQLGQPLWRPGSPAGYDDIAESWAAPNALLRRVEMAQRLVAPLGDQLDARALADKLLLGAVSAETITAIKRAESASTALALLLVSPEFLRR